MSTTPTRSLRVERSYTNKFNQVIEVGDEVVFVATSWGGTDIRQGVYLGYYPRTGWDGRPALHAASVSYIGKEWDGRKWIDDAVLHSVLELGRVFKIEKV